MKRLSGCIVVGFIGVEAFWLSNNLRYGGLRSTFTPSLPKYHIPVSSHVKTSNSASSITKGTPMNYWGRESERAYLLKSFSIPPCSIRVIEGVSNCGLTAFLKDCAQQDSPSQSMCRIDCRAFKATPSSFAHELAYKAIPYLLKCLRMDDKKTVARVDEICSRFASSTTLLDKFAQGLARFGPSGGRKLNTNVWACNEKSLRADAYALPSLNGVLQVYQNLLELMRKNGEMCPVLIVDHAEAIMKWPKSERDFLLDVFIRITKQERQCHVVLAASCEYSFHDWMGEAMWHGYWDLCVLGDFPKHEARQFLDTRLQSSTNVTTDEDWENVYEVCGGNAGTLSMAASDYMLYDGNWKEALFERWRNYRDHLEKASCGSAHYTAQQFDAAVQLLLKSEHNAVSRMDMQVELGRCLNANPNPNPNSKEISDFMRAGEPALDALIRARILILRPYSGFARDIPKSAYGMHGGTLVIASSPVYLYCMRQL